jgi:uncharacterized protein YjiS (DUF1127 family)
MRIDGRMSAMVMTLIQIFVKWRARVRTEEELQKLTDRDLKDIGLTRYDISSRWKGPIDPPT